MSFSQVLNQYLKAMGKQGARRVRQGRDFFTKNEQKANQYYGDACIAIKELDFKENNGNETEKQESN